MLARARSRGRNHAGRHRHRPGTREAGRRPPVRRSQTTGFTPQSESIPTKRKRSRRPPGDAGAAGAASQGDRLGRDRPRLFLRPFAARRAGAASFGEQIELAHAAKLPIIIHCRDAWPDCLDLLDEVLATDRPGRHSALLHQHPGGRAPRHRHGLSGILRRQCDLSKGAESSRRCAKICRWRQLLIETDSPYLAPQASARQAQRARLRCGSGEDPCECEKLAGRGHRRTNHREISGDSFLSPGQVHRTLGSLAESGRRAQEKSSHF